MKDIIIKINLTKLADFMIDAQRNDSPHYLRKFLKEDDFEAINWTNRIVDGCEHLHKLETALVPILKQKASEYLNNKGENK